MLIERFELPTFDLQKRCSTTELNKLNRKRESNSHKWCGRPPHYHYAISAFDIERI